MALEPLDKSLIRQQGDRALGVKSCQFVRYLAQARFAKNKVPCPREERGQFTDGREVRNEDRPQRGAMGIVITLQELGLHLAHVHVRSALRFATLATHAEIQHVVKRLALHRLLTTFSHELA